MLLKTLAIHNFACFDGFLLPDLGRLAVFIGANDTGKTNVLNAVDLLLSNVLPHADNFRKLPDGNVVADMSLEATFTLEGHDSLPVDYRSGANQDEFHIRKLFSENSSQAIVRGLGYSDARFDTFTGRDRQFELLQQYDVTPASRQQERIQQVEALVAAGKLSRVERDIQIPQPGTTLGPHLPLVVRIAAADYRTPEAMIQQNLVRVGRSVLEPSPTANGTPEERPALRELRKEIEARMNEELQKAIATLKELHPKLRNVSVVPSIDFSRAVAATHLTVDLGEGEQLLDGCGEGTKKRLWLGLLEWEQEITKTTTAGSVIRLYDEPDASLHYDAQRRLFANISELATDPALRTQCLVSTHSVTLIDRAPLTDINLLAIEDDYRRSTSRLETFDDESIPEFFSEIGASVGLSNVALLYEKGFLVIEGPSEEEFIRYIYLFLHGQSPIQDGIVIVKLHGCGAWKSVLDVLLKNRASMTHFLFDADCQQPDSAGYMTIDYLKELGIPPEFIDDQVTYIGQKEIEDAFADDVIARALNAEFPLDTGGWQPADVADLRGGDKFSDDLRNTILARSIPTVRSNAKKPAIAAAIARAVQAPTEVPEAIRCVFDDIRRRAGIT